MGTKILHLIASNFISGPEKQILHHASDLAGSGYEVSVASFRDSPAVPEIVRSAQSSNIPAYCLPGGFNPMLVLALAKVLRQEHIDILCTHGYKANITGRAAALLSSVPQVAFVRGWTAETSRVALYEKIERRILSTIPWVVCVSSLQAAQLAPLRKGKRRPAVIPNAVLSWSDRPDEKSLSRVDAGIPDDAFVFGSVGRLSIEKGHTYLLEAFAKLCRGNPARNLYLILLGDGRELAALQQQAVDLGITERTMFAGFQHNCRPWMRLLDCMVQPSLTEGTPNSVLEALRDAIPVIATAVGGVPDLLRDDEGGLLMPPSDSEKLASAMERVMNSPELRARLSHGIDTIDPRYLPETQRASLIQLYKDVLLPMPGTLVGRRKT
jgi:glycosyltransferase involved in cell wall biosynthesis